MTYASARQNRGCVLYGSCDCLGRRSGYPVFQGVPLTESKVKTYLSKSNRFREHRHRENSHAPIA